jgi:hypothetical protein
MKSLLKAVTTTFCFLVTINVFTTDVEGAAYQNNVVFCSDIVPSDESNSFEVCATAYYFTPSPFALENGTTGYAGGYTNGYTIVQGIEDGEEETGNTEENTGIQITVSRDDLNVCTVSVIVKEGGADTKCTSCSYCGNDAYKANCTNIQNGRMLDICESAGEDVVFFPLTIDALGKEDSDFEAYASLFSLIMTRLQNFLKRVGLTNRSLD